MRVKKSLMPWPSLASRETKSWISLEGCSRKCRIHQIARLAGSCEVPVRPEGAGPHQTHKGVVNGGINCLSDLEIGWFIT